MTIGPVEYLLVEFPGSRFKGEIIPELAKLVDGGLISLIDLVFVIKGEDGTVASFDLDEIEDTDTTDAFESVEGGYGGVVSDDDILAAAEALEPGSSAGLIVFENLWAAPFVQAIRNAGGLVVANQRIPGDIVDAAIAASTDHQEAGAQS